MPPVGGSQSRFTVDLEPVGRRIDVPVGATLLEAAQLSGIELIATCGGVGVCESCRVQLIDGVLSETTLNEQEELTDRELDDGFRLACQAEILSDVRVVIPADSLAAPQRLQLEGRHKGVALDPPVKAFFVSLAKPTMADLRSDDRRLREALELQGVVIRRANRAALIEASARLREYDWSALAAVRDGELVAVLPPSARPLGLAFDIGTTKLAGYLIDLQSGEVLARAGATNPQIAFGEDVISRISYFNKHAEEVSLLQTRLVDAMNTLLQQLCAESDTDPGHIVETVAVGNTAMQHLLLGLPVRQLGESPYVAVTTDPLTVRASDIGLQAAPGTTLYTPSNVAGYVGSDHVAMVLAAQALDLPAAIADSAGTVLYVDIGTNTELSLVREDQILTCSCASGPAFEGAHIRDGMRAAPGAIEHVHLRADQFQLHTIGDQCPVGICGSGILDAVAALRDAGILDARGSFRKDCDDPRVRAPNGRAEFVLVDAADTGHGADIVISRSDVNEIQLAKSAIRAGIELLLDEADMKSEDIDHVVVAGAFGTYLRIESAIKIGLFPALPLERFSQVGNAAGMGAIQLVLSRDKRDAAASLAQRMTYIELTNHKGFNDAFVDALLLQADAQQTTDRNGC